ncbi:NTP-binding protein [Marinobacter salinus]|uniref:NTP-binding protein n=1 Tax=Marinobacter salinus TaxID=1874317 RepID=A0A1D9GHX0_9GAMM|nr:STAS domain-containing protein [Marinobacter salinus]AOY87095.1 NTP-binding protein [Marinobacter salinus]
MTSPASQVQLRDHALVVTGEVTADTVVGLRKEGEKLIGTVAADLVVDLENLAEAHSIVLSLLLCWQRLAGQRGIALSYRGVSDRLASLAALSNLDDQLVGFGPDSQHPSH